MDLVNVSLKDALFISIFSMVVVFLILLMISYIIEFIAFILKKFNK